MSNPPGGNGLSFSFFVLKTGSPTASTPVAVVAGRSFMRASAVPEGT